MKRGSLISIVFSFKNEQEVIPELLKRLRAVFQEQLKDYKYEFIFVDDRSTDGSLELLRSESVKDPGIKILLMTRTFGVAECVMAGLEYSTGDAVIMMDTDLQDPPEVIPELVNRWNEGAEVVYTVRLKREKESAAKLMATQIGYRILRSISSVDIPVESGDFRLMSRRAVDQMLSLKENSPFIRGLVRWIGYRQEPVHYTREGRVAGETHFVFYKWRVIKNFLNGVTSFSDTPLYMTFLLGILVSSVSFSYMVAVLVLKLLGSNIPGATIATIAFLGGVQILSIGILGIYIAKIHIQVKGRPNYIVDEKVGFK